MLTTVRHIFGRIMHSETALCSQWDKGWKNNLLFASPSIRRPTAGMHVYFYCIFIFLNPVFWLQAVHIPVQSHIIPGCALADAVFYGCIAFA